MSAKVEIRLEIYTNNDWLEIEPDFALVIFNKDLIDKIDYYQRAMLSVGADKISCYSYEPDFKCIEVDENYEETGNLVDCEDFRTELMMMNVTGTSVYWSFCIKHTNDELTTERISLESIKQLYLIESTPSEDLPTLINMDFKCPLATTRYRQRLEESKASTH